jgi:hypothetical protein
MQTIAGSQTDPGNLYVVLYNSRQGFDLLNFVFVNTE